MAKKWAKVKWSLVGEQKPHNGLDGDCGGSPCWCSAAADAANALGSFINARRRLELRGEANGVTVYDDFAHHPTAILATLAALRGKVGGTARIIAGAGAALEYHENGDLQRRSGTFIRSCR